MIFSAMMIVLVGCNKTEKPKSDTTLEVINTKKEVKEGDFIYRLVSEKEVYAENGPIQLYAELEYIGDKTEIEIFHAASPFYFPMVEKTRDYQIEYAMNEPLLSTTLIKGEPLRQDYVGSGGFSEHDRDEYVKFIKRVMDSEFPTGHYVVNGAANFFVRTNGNVTEEKKDFKIEVQVEFKVKAEDKEF